MIVCPIDLWHWDAMETSHHQDQTIQFFEPLSSLFHWVSHPNPYLHGGCNLSEALFNCVGPGVGLCLTNLNMLSASPILTEENRYNGASFGVAPRFSSNDFGGANVLESAKPCKLELIF